MPHIDIGLSFFLSFWCGPFFKSFYWICLHFMFWFFGHEACGILAPPPEIEPILPELEGRVLTIGPPGKSHRAFFEGAATRSSKQEERHSPLHHGCHCVTDLPNLGLISACLARLLSSFMAFISYFPRAWDRWHSALLSLTSLQGGAARLLACLPEPERLSSPLRDRGPHRLKPLGLAVEMLMCLVSKEKNLEDLLLRQILILQG